MIIILLLSYWKLNWCDAIYWQITGALKIVEFPALKQTNFLILAVFGYVAIGFLVFIPAYLAANLCVRSEARTVRKVSGYCQTAPAHPACSALMD